MSPGVLLATKWCRSALPIALQLVYACLAACSEPSDAVRQMDCMSTVVLSDLEGQQHF